MFNRNYRIALVISVLLAFLPALTSAGNHLTLDMVVGDQIRDGEIMYDHSGNVAFLFSISVDQNIADHLIYVGHAFYGYTTGDVTRSELRGFWEPSFLPGVFAFPVTATWFGPDTAALYGYSMGSEGVPAGYNSNAFYLTISFSDADLATNPTFCLDFVTQWPPALEWKWTDADDNDYFPAWEGPYCFELVRCCDGMTGNINDDPNDDVDISDLTAMVNYLFGPHIPIPCVDEADVNGDGTVDISDVVYFVNFLFLLADPPAPCF